MASIYRHNAGWRVQFYVRGRRVKIYLGRCSKSHARQVAAQIDQMLTCDALGLAYPSSVREWLGNIGPRLRSHLARFGLVETARDDLPTCLADFCNRYFADRTDWRPRTLSRMQNVRRHLVDAFGNCRLDQITVADAEQFARKIRSNYASSHAGKILADAKQILTHAVKSRVLASSPFVAVDSRGQHDRDREAYVPAADAMRLLECATPFYAALIASARFGGLRVPSEPLGLTWSDVDWSRGRVVIRSPKTASTRPTRVVPLFAAWRPHLDRLFAIAADDAAHVFTEYRTTASKVWRSNLLSTIAAAGLEPWPKLWMNLRASCRTDLLEQFPEHVVDAWLGHSSKTGRKHYNRVTDQHFELATLGVAVGVVGPPSPASPRQQNRSNA